MENIYNDGTYKENNPAWTCIHPGKKGILLRLFKKICSIIKLQVFEK